MTAIKKKHFDCIKLKNRIQAEVYSETKNMSKIELLLYFNGNVKHEDNSQIQHRRKGWSMRH